MSKYVVISREFGSGGREVGVKLGELLGLPVYDKEIIAEAAAAKGSTVEELEGIEEARSEAHPEKKSKLFSKSSFYYRPHISDEMFFAQADAITRLASKGDCIFIGRCADFVLKDKDVVRVFIHADVEKRIDRKLRQANEPLDDMAKRDAMRKEIKRVDKVRKNYFEFHTDWQWGEASNYDICINTSNCAPSDAAEVIKAFLSHC